MVIKLIARYNTHCDQKLVSIRTDIFKSAKIDFFVDTGLFSLKYRFYFMSIKSPFTGIKIYV